MILYKYRSMKDPYLEDVILNQNIYFSAPRKFNDPFDFYPVINIVGTKKDVTACRKRIVQDNYPSYDRNQIKAEIKEFRKRTPNLQKFMDNIDIKKELDHFKTYCLSKTQKSILMWSHYANEHKGICLGFESVVGSTFGNAKEVNYDKNRYNINWLLQDRDKQLINSLYHKSIDWAYEKERRIIYPDHPGKQSYQPNELKEVIFGDKITDKDRQLMLVWLNKLEHKPILLQASLHPTKYEMKIDYY